MCIIVMPQKTADQWLEQSRDLNVKYESQLKSASKEIAKGNDIIRKLQSAAKLYRAKAKEEKSACKEKVNLICNCSHA